MAAYYDFGTIYTLAGVSGITSSYQTSSFIQAGAAGTIKLKIVIVTDAASTLTGLNVKAQALWTAGGTDTGDLISYKLDTNTGQPELVHTYSSLATGSTVTFFVKIADGSHFKGGAGVAVQGTFSSGGAKAGDSVTISAVGW